MLMAFFFVGGGGVRLVVSWFFLFGVSSFLFSLVVLCREHY